MSKTKKILAWVGGILLALILIAGAIVIFAPDALFYPYILIKNNQETTSFEVHEDEVWMNGYINSKTYDQFVKVLEENPHIKTIVKLIIPGSMIDETNIKLAYFVREH